MAWDKLTPAERQDIFWGQTRLAEERTASGRYLGGNPLHPTSTATSVRVRDGQRLLTDGPHASASSRSGR